MIYTSGSGETLQPVISGGVDLGLAVGTLGAMAAYSKGAPVRIIGAQATGAADYWYAKNPGHQDAQGHQRPHHRLFDQRLVDPQRRARLHRRIQADRAKTAGDRQSERDADRRDDRPGRCRLGLAAVRPEGDGGRQDSHRRQAPPMPRWCAGRPSASWSPMPNVLARPKGRHRALHAGLSRNHRLHVFGQSAGDQGLRRVRQSAGSDGQARARRVLPEEPGQSRPDSRPRYVDAGGGEPEIHSGAAQQGADRRVDPDSATQDERARKRVRCST